MQRSASVCSTTSRVTGVRGTIDVIDLHDGTCLAVYSTEADPRTMALVIGGGSAGALNELKRQMEAGPESAATEGQH